MAPLRPSKRSSIRARAAKSTSADPRGKYAPPLPSAVADVPEPSDLKPALKSTTSNSTSFGLSDADWRLNKKDKRTIKHNALLDRVRFAGVEKPGKKTLKRRRPSKKLVTDLDSLADALPDADMEEEEDDEWEGLSDEDGEGMDITSTGSTTTTKKRRVRRKVPAAGTDGKMVMTSLKHKPGAMKRKKVMEERERERLGRNLAAMMVGKENDGGAGGEAGDGGKGQAEQKQREKWAALRAFIGGTMQVDKAFGKG